MKVAYLRCSSDSQSTESQKVDLKVDRVYEDIGVSGIKPFSQRPAAKRLIADILAGKIESVEIARLDRLTRGGVGELLETAEFFAQHRVQLISKAEAFQLLDGDGNRSAIGTLFLSLLGSLSGYERSLLRSRQKAGIAAKRLRDPDAYPGRKKGTTTSPRNFLNKIKSKKVRALLAEGYPKTYISKVVPCSTATVYKVVRILDELGEVA